ncbi:MAG: trypsin-like peptidase domain-containing protein, partial [Bacillus sp. (in: firmicutes)]
MGYYDQDYEGRYKQPKRNKSGYIIASLVGGILGAMLVIVSLPQLTDLGVLPYQPSTENNAVNNQRSSSGGTKNVSVDVTSQVTKAVEKAGDTVVAISNLQETGFWFGESSRQEAGTGSGVIYKIEGNKAFVVTNHHVVDGAKELEITLSDGTKHAAKLRGSDVWTDLAVLELEAKNIKNIAEFGDSDSIQVGEPAIAIGNPLGATFSGSVTQGIISGLERTIPIDINSDGIEDWQAEVIQTDAAINPGNSGGALVNIDGQLIGINSMKIAESSVEGIGLAIPINYAIPIIEDLEKHGEVKRPYMGVELQSV